MNAMMQEADVSRWYCGAYFCNTLRLKSDTNTNIAYRLDYSQKMAAAYR
jgi:hypothetical protein